MPADATVNENFHDYVLGVYDGQPKTPQWATVYCGTPIEDIEWYARLQAKDNNVMNLHSYAAARYNGAEYFPQLFLTIGCMGGHLGKPGNATGGIFSFSAGNSGEAIVQCGAPLPDLASMTTGNSAIGTLTIANPNDDAITGPEMWSAVLKGSYRYMGTISYADGSSSIVEPKSATSTSARTSPRTTRASPPIWTSTRPSRCSAGSTWWCATPGSSAPRRSIRTSCCPARRAGRTPNTKRV